MRLYGIQDSIGAHDPRRTAYRCFRCQRLGSVETAQLADYPAIVPPYVAPKCRVPWTPYQRDEKTGSRYWAIPGTEGFTHILGGLEKDNKTGAISTDLRTTT